MSSKNEKKSVLSITLEDRKSSLYNTAWVKKEEKRVL